MSHPARQYYKQAKKYFRSCLRLHRKTSDNFFASLDHQSTDPQQFFRTLRKFTSSSCQPITQRLVLGDRVFNNNSILDGWASYFESLSVPDSTPLNEDQNNVLASYLHSCSLPTDDPVLVEEDEVEAIVRSLPLRKAPGPDHITNEHLKFGSSKLSSILTVLFNAILTSGHVPLSFRHGLIIPIPKGHNKDMTNPSNYRGITLSSVLSKVFEKIILLRLVDQASQLNPLQGGFRSGHSCLHTAFILQEAIFSLREQRKKAFVAFIDVKKAFDTVWHIGLMFKLSQYRFPIYIWRIIDSWYSGSTSAVLWNSSISRTFCIRQGVRQGATLSPLLYSLFVDDLLDRLSTSGYGVSIDGVYCGAPMYADDLALISDSEAGLQHMLDIVSEYAHLWRYRFNLSKSSVLVFGETSVSRKKNRITRKWWLSGDSIPECDTQHHLGVLRSVSPSSALRTAERCSSGRSAFFALNGIGSRFGCLHPSTSLRLYTVYCIPILLYGCELWSLTGTELTMLERVHRKVLRTILGLPLRCQGNALLHLLGVPSIKLLICQRQLNFLLTFSTLSPLSLPVLVFNKRLSTSPQRGVIPSIKLSIESLSLPSLSEIVSGEWSKNAWKRLVKNVVQASQYSSFLETCDHLPLSNYLHSLGKPIPHLSITKGLPNLTRWNNFRMRLLVGCHGLEEDACRFRHRRFLGRVVDDPTCILCGLERDLQLQQFIIEFLCHLRQARNALLLAD